MTRENGKSKLGFSLELLFIFPVRKGENMSPVLLKMMTTKGEVLKQAIAPDSNLTGEDGYHMAAIVTELGPVYAISIFTKITESDGKLFGYHSTLRTLFPGDRDWKENRKGKDGEAGIPAGTYAERRQRYYTGTDENVGFILESRVFQQGATGNIFRRKK